MLPCSIEERPSPVDLCPGSTSRYLGQTALRKAPYPQGSTSTWHSSGSERRRIVCCCASTSSGSVQFDEGTGSSSFAAEDVDSDAKEALEPRETNGAAPTSELPKSGNPVNRRFSAWRREVRRLKHQLQGYGAAGLLSYGFLNSVYYSAAFIFFWNVAKVPRGLGWAEVIKQFATVMGVTWAASQVTKIPRAAFALVLAPTVDGVLIYLQTRLRLRTRRNATIVFVSLCLLVAAITFGCTLLLWA